jgi:cytochrome P450
MVVEALARWMEQPELVLVPEVKRLAIEIICATVFGVAPGPLTAALRRDYELVLAAFPALPVPLPGTTFNRGRQALRRILERFTAVVEDRQRTPTGDGLSRILAAKDAAGRQIGVAECTVELHHLIIAGLIVFAEFAGTLLALERNPEVRARLAAEISALPPGPIGAATLAGAPYLLQVVMEVKRVTPVIPVVFGKARQSFEFKGYTVPAGWMVLWAVYASLQSAETYSEPSRFDPDRFAPPRAEHLGRPHAFAPQGTGPAEGHRCAGSDFSTCLMAVFALLLVRDAEWEIAAAQDLEPDWGRIPPEPRSGLRVRLKRRAAVQLPAS